MFPALCLCIGTEICYNKNNRSREHFKRCVPAAPRAVSQGGRRGCSNAEQKTKTMRAAPRQPGAARNFEQRRGRPVEKRAKRKEFLLDIAYDLAGSVLFGVGVYTFALKGGFAPGGLSGLALIVNYLFGLPVGTVSLVLNIPIILCTYKTLGHRFFIKSLRTMLISTAIIALVRPLFPVYEGNRLLAAVFSGILMGAGLSIIYMRGSSTGGADFLIHTAKRKAPHMSFGQISLAMDGVIILLGVPAFGDIDSALYGMIAAFALTIVMDKIMYGAGSGKLTLIITDRGAEVAKAIDEAVERGSTLVDVTGSYSGLGKCMVMCACSNNEVFKVRTAAHGVDRGAMVMICEANEVFGEGFHPPEIQQK